MSQCHSISLNFCVPLSQKDLPSEATQKPTVPVALSRRLIFNGEVLRITERPTPLFLSGLSGNLGLDKQAKVKPQAKMMQSVHCEWFQTTCIFFLKWWWTFCSVIMPSPYLLSHLPDVSCCNVPPTGQEASLQQADWCLHVHHPLLQKQSPPWPWRCNWNGQIDYRFWLEPGYEWKSSNGDKEQGREEPTMTVNGDQNLLLAT